MKWTNRQKLAGGVLLAAVAAFTADRLTAAGAANASAGSVAIVAAGADDRTPAADRPTTAGANAVAPRAIPATAKSGTAAAPSTGGTSVPASSAATAQLARWLDRVAATEGLEPGLTADAFRPPEAWFPVVTKNGEVKAAAEDRVGPFKARHKLTAVMRGGPKGERGVAILGGGGGGMAVRVGQAVDGFVLTAVGDSTAVFTAGGDAVELTLDRPIYSSAAMGH